LMARIRLLGREDQHARHAGQPRGGGGDAGMIGLDGADRDEVSRLAADRVGYNVLEFAGFVATEGGTGEVVTLDEDLRAPAVPAQRGAQTRKLMDRRGPVDEWESR